MPSATLTSPLLPTLPLLLLSLLSTTSLAASSIACNNSPSLCSRSYSNITHLGAHDSPFLRDASTDYSDSGNQYYNSTVQLSAGVRLLTGQIFSVNDTSTGDEVLHLCHSSCDLLDAGPLSDWLSDIKAWLDENTYDVVTLLLVNGDDSTADTIASGFETADLTSYAYTPSSVSSPPTDGIWPTLATLIAANTRLITFIASLPSLSASAPYLLSEFTFVFENPYDVTSSTAFTCVPSRPTSVSGSISAALAANLLPLMNHFLYVDEGLGIEAPDVADIYITNAPVGSVNASGTASLGPAAEECAEEYGGRNPVFLLVDFFNVGPAIDVVDDLNGVTDATGRTAVSDATLSATSGAVRGGKGSVVGVLVGVLVWVVVVGCAW